MHKHATAVSKTNADQHVALTSIKQLGLKRFELTLPTYLFMGVTLVTAWLLGILPIQAVVMAIAPVMAGLLVFYVILRWFPGISPSDPMLIFPQILFNIAGIAINYGVTDHLRNISVLWISLIVTFDMRRLPSGRLRFVLAYTLVLFGLATLWQMWRQPLAYLWVEELFAMTSIAVALPALLIVSTEARAIQRRHQVQKEQLDGTFKRLRQLSITDGLTSLYNRRHMSELLHAEVMRSSRSGRPFCVAIIDIDFFKRVNDRFGHVVGDQVLQHFSSVVAGSLSSGMDMVARWGGEEFLILLPERGVEESRRVLQTLHQAIANEDWTQLHPDLTLTFSGGIAQHQIGTDHQMTVVRADKALYEAKAEGRNRTVTCPALSDLAVPKRAQFVKRQDMSPGQLVQRATPHPEPSGDAAFTPAVSANQQAPGSNSLTRQDSRLRGAMSMTLVTATVYLGCILGFYFYVIPYKVLTPSLGMLFIAHNFLGMVAPYALLKSGLASQLKNSGLPLLLQLLWACAGLIAGYGLMRNTHATSLQLLCLCVVFGFLGLRPKQIVLLGVSIIVTLVGVLAALAQQPNIDPFTFRIDALEVLSTCVIVGLLSAQSYNLSVTRNKVRQDKQALAEATARLAETVRTDPLTGLVNRRHMQNLLARETERCAVSPNGFCIALIDLDHFKQINDALGHQVGDDVLVTLGKMALGNLREADVLCRWGGEEFLALLPETEPGVSGLQAIDRLRVSLTQHFAGMGSMPMVSFSAGVTQHRRGESCQATLERADQALYEAKRSGRNCSKLA